jgi:hypothetical protein
LNVKNINLQINLLKGTPISLRKIAFQVKMIQNNKLKYRTPLKQLYRNFSSNSKIIPKNYIMLYITNHPQITKKFKVFFLKIRRKTLEVNIAMSIIAKNIKRKSIISAIKITLKQSKQSYKVNQYKISDKIL